MYRLPYERLGRRLNFLRHWLLEKLSDHLTLSLLLATVFSAVAMQAPAWVQGYDSTMMRMAYRFDVDAEEFVVGARNMLLPSFLASDDPWPALFGAFRGQVLTSLFDKKRTTVTLISLRPAAWSHYLSGTIPVPRVRLACLLYALGERLAMSDIKDWRPVVGVDIDVTPTEFDAVRQPDEKACRATLWPPSTPTSQAEYMSRALEKLGADGRCAVVIATLRNTNSAARLEFMNRYGNRSRSSTNPLAPCVGFATSDITHVPHELVFEYATRLRSSGTGPGFVGPEEICTLGRALGAFLHDSRVGNKASADGRPTVCGRGYPVDPKFLVEGAEQAPQFYDHKVMALGLAKAIMEYPIAAPEPAHPTPAAAVTTTSEVECGPDVLCQARNALKDLRPADIYIVTADDGTTADKFLVPVEDSAVPGAWVHGAIALSEFKDLDGSPGDSQKALEYLEDVAKDLAIAILSAVLIDALQLSIAKYARSVPLRDLCNAIGPLAVVLVVLGVDMHIASRELAAGQRWHSPLPLLIGVLLHAYLHMTEAHAAPSQDEAQARHGPHRAATVKPARGRPDVTRWARHPFTTTLQWLWAATIVAASLTGLLPEERGGWPFLAVFGGVLGVAYLFACRSIPSLPLPWSRPHEAPAQSH